MSWVRLPAALRGRPEPIAGAAPRVDPTACYSSFCRHWQQAHEIMSKAPRSAPAQDDVLAVLGHLEHLTTLLLLEIRNEEGEEMPCLDTLMSEDAFRKLFAWGSATGRYLNAVRTEQAKLYSLLVTHSGRRLLCAEPFLRPLLRLLHSFHNEILPEEIAGRLVGLVKSVCTVLMQNSRFMDLFFYPESEDDRAQFLPVTLLLSYVHREGSVGQQARAAFLLCASLSSENERVANYIAETSNACPLLATGLSGLYSSLPRNLDVSQPDWHRLTPDDVNDVPKLSLFMNSLEFCNAVCQVAHPKVRSRLLEYFYQGFLLPVMGPALLQSGVDEQVAAVAYLELALRSAGDPGLLKSFVKFLLDKNYDGLNILDTVIPFIEAESRLSIVTISLLETLVDLDCEDLMIELIFRHLLNGDRPTCTESRPSLDCDVLCRATDMFLALSPECCSSRPAIPRKTGGLSERKLSTSSQDWPTSLTSTESSPPNRVNYPYGLNSAESLYGNYHAYLCDARKKISRCKKVCYKWSSKYDAYDVQKYICKNSKNAIVDFRPEIEMQTKDADDPNGEESLRSMGESSGYESFKYKNDECKTSADEADEDVCSEDSFWKSIDHHTSKICHNSAEKSVEGSIDFDIGPLLKFTLRRLNDMLDNDIFVNLRLTGLISRLAAYPLPILRSFLLTPWNVYQPTVTSLYQVLVTLKQKIDQTISIHEPDYQRLFEEGQSYLIEREIRLANTRKNAIESTSSKTINESNKLPLNDESSSQPNSGNWNQSGLTSSPEPFRRNEPKRRSLFGPIFNRKGIFGGMGNSAVTSSQTQTDSTPMARMSIDSSLYSSLAEDNLWHSSNKRRVILNALILDEWLKELGALAQEHVVSSLSEIMHEAFV